jgi:hypothetical protein
MVARALALVQGPNEKRETMSALSYCRTLALRIIICICSFLCFSPGHAEQLSGRWADNPKSCHGDHSGSGNDGTDFQLIDFGTRRVAFFDAECPLTEFVPESKIQSSPEHIFRGLCKGEGSDGPPFWLFMSKQSNSLTIFRVNLPANKASYQYSLHRCP